jgi:hypothetical protein
MDTTSDLDMRHAPSPAPAHSAHDPGTRPPVRHFLIVTGITLAAIALSIFVPAAPEAPNDQLQPRSKLATQRIQLAEDALARPAAANPQARAPESTVSLSERVSAP